MSLFVPINLYVFTDIWLHADILQHWPIDMKLARILHRGGQGKWRKLKEHGTPDYIYHDLGLLCTIFYNNTYTCIYKIQVYILTSTCIIMHLLFQRPIVMFIFARHWYARKSTSCLCRHICNSLSITSCTSGGVSADPLQERSRNALWRLSTHRKSPDDTSPGRGGWYRSATCG